MHVSYHDNLLNIMVCVRQYLVGEGMQKDGSSIIYRRQGSGKGFACFDSRRGAGLYGDSGVFRQMCTLTLFRISQISPPNRLRSPCIGLAPPIFFCIPAPLIAFRARCPILQKICYILTYVAHTKYQYRVFSKVSVLRQKIFSFKQTIFYRLLVN